MEVHPITKPEYISVPSSSQSILKLLNTNCTFSLQHLKQTHALILKTNHFQDHFVSGSLLKSYANPSFHSFHSFLRVFHQVPNPNVFVWNSLFKGCLDNIRPGLALSFYLSYMSVSDSSRPNKFTYPTLFKACTDAGAVEEGFQIHAHVVKHGMMGDRYVKSAGIHMYSSFGCLVEARRILDMCGGESSDAVCFNAMIDGYMGSGDVEAAQQLFDLMPERNVSSWNAMICGFAELGMIEEARELFDAMPHKDEISWSAMIDGYNKGGYFNEALEIFSRMQQTQKVKPTKFLLSSVLAACASAGALDQGRWIHTYAKRNSIPINSVLATSLLDMYVECGRLDLAWEVFEDMKQKEVQSWNAMIKGLAVHGRANDAIELFLKMHRENLKPDEITLTGVLNACAHTGLVDDGLKYFDTMDEVYGIKPTVEHYGCVVDLLARAGFLDEAVELINGMPMAPSSAVWGALLGGCRIHGDFELGERVGKVLLEMEPENGGRYALLSSMYAEAGRWEDVGEVRKTMKGRGVKANTGRSMIELDGTVHEFRMGDVSHPQRERIYSILKNTSEVLFDNELLPERETKS